MVKKANGTDIETLASLAILLWDSHTIKELADDFSNTMQKEDAQFFIKYYLDEPIGFAQCQLRYDYVEGTEHSPVGYLEGIFVKEEHRKKGYAKEMLIECETWALSKGCKEFASDCELDNTTSLNFHIRMGFVEANRIICFTKTL